MEAHCVFVFRIDHEEDGTLIGRANFKTDKTTTHFESSKHYLEERVIEELLEFARRKLQQHQAALAVVNFNE